MGTHRVGVAQRTAAGIPGYPLDALAVVITTDNAEDVFLPGCDRPPRPQVQRQPLHRWSPPAAVANPRTPIPPSTEIACPVMGPLCSPLARRTHDPVKSRGSVLESYSGIGGGGSPGFCFAKDAASVRSCMSRATGP